jgi:hypothetical protein
MDITPVGTALRVELNVHMSYRLLDCAVQLNSAEQGNTYNLPSV